MSFETVVRCLPERTVREFERALRQGHWGNGWPLTDQHREICEQAVLVWRLAGNIAPTTIH